MRLNWHRPSRSEEYLETWIGQHHQERVLAGDVAPVGPCPDEAFLQHLARKSKRIALSDPRVDHAASCPACTRQILALRSQVRSHRRRIVFATAAACIVIAVVWIALIRFSTHGRQPATNLTIVSETVNLWNANTIRGTQPSPLQSVSLPAAVVRVTVILPRFSESGKYMVAVTRDQAGDDVVAEGTAGSSRNGDREEVSVDLDLRHATAGKYFLSTTHEQDQSSYYYPLRIK